MTELEEIANIITKNDLVPSPLIKILEEYYETGRRRYHNLNHILFMLRKIDKERFEYKEKIIYILSAIFHDAVYRIGADDNEIKSAELFESFIADNKNIIDGMKWKEFSTISENIDSCDLCTSSNYIFSNAYKENNAWYSSEGEHITEVITHFLISRLPNEQVILPCDIYKVKKNILDTACMDYDTIFTAFDRYRLYFGNEHQIFEDSILIMKEYEIVTSNEKFIEGRIAFLEGITKNKEAIEKSIKLLRKYNK